MSKKIKVRAGCGEAVGERNFRGNPDRRAHGGSGREAAKSVVEKERKRVEWFVGSPLANPIP